MLAFTQSFPTEPPTAVRPWLRWIQWPRRRQSRQQIDDACAFVPRILETLPTYPALPAPTEWRIQDAHLVETRTAVVITLGPPETPPVALLKLWPTIDAAASSHWQTVVLDTLQEDSRLGAWRELLPQSLAMGKMDGRYYTIVNCLPGTELAVEQPSLQAAAAAIQPLHRATAVSVTVDKIILAHWVAAPWQHLQTWNQSLPRFLRFDDGLIRLWTELHETLNGRTLPASWIHGDFHPGNLLAAPDSGKITGILDWDRAAPDELPLIDYIHLLLFARRRQQDRELGEIVIAFLAGDGWTADEEMVLNRSSWWSAGDVAGDRAFILLTWLRHVTTNLANKTDRYQTKWWWLAKNVVNVLRYFGNL